MALVSGNLLPQFYRVSTTDWHKQKTEREQNCWERNYREIERKKREKRHAFVCLRKNVLTKWNSINERKGHEWTERYKRKTSEKRKRERKQSTFKTGDFKRVFKLIERTIRRREHKCKRKKAICENETIEMIRGVENNGNFRYTRI